MSRSHASARRFASTAACGFAVAVATLLAGCSSSAPTAPSGAGAGAPSGAALAVSDASDKGGAQLWTENCSRCHNTRSPDYYTPGRWALVSQHMRVRGYLTGEEERQITAFLQPQ